MANDDRVGGVLLASLHQAIGEVLPARRAFYETWLEPSTLSAGIGVSSFTAVASALRQEGDAYDLVMTLAGQHAATWSFDALPAPERAFVRALPRGLRTRTALRLVKRLLAGLYGESQAEMARRGSTVFIDLQGSPFCTGATARRPLCGFYASAIATYFRALNLDAAVRVSRCRASRGTSCLLLALIDNVDRAQSLSQMSSERRDFTLDSAAASPVEPIEQFDPGDYELVPATEVERTAAAASVEPVVKPVVEPTLEPTLEPTIDPIADPVALPIVPMVPIVPTVEASDQEAAEPSAVADEETSRTDIEAQWATIPPPPGKRGMSPFGGLRAEDDPEAPWRRL